MYKVEVYSFEGGERNCVIQSDFDNEILARAFKTQCEDVYPDFTVVFTNMNFWKTKLKWSGKLKSDLQQ